MKVAPNKIIFQQKPPLNPDVNDFASAIFFFNKLKFIN